MPEASDLVVQGTVSALKAIRPDLTDTIEAAAALVGSERESLRFLLKSRETKRFIVEISCNISEWREPSGLFVSITDRSNGEYLEAAPIALGFYMDALDLAGTVRVDGDAVRIMPRQSFRARMTASPYRQKLNIAVSDFCRRERPVFSKLLKWQG